MAIPSRLQVKNPTKKLLREMMELCSSIERSPSGSVQQSELIAKWNQKTARPCERHEFENYWRSVDQETFVRLSLCPPARYLADLTYLEAYGVLEELCAATLPENLMTYYINFLDLQFPNSRVSDLIYWPDCWFDDPLLIREASGAFKPESNLTTEQILQYLMAKSNRQLPESGSDVKLPFPVPTLW
jgi:hypothetical protein